MTTLDYIAHLDDPETGQIDSEVNRQVEEELAKVDTTQIHPLVKAKFPLVVLEQPVKMVVSERGLGMDSLGKKYTDLEATKTMGKAEKMQLLASYSMLRSRKLELFNRYEGLIASQWADRVGDLKQLDAELDEQINKRQLDLEDVEEQRKRRCLEFEPVYEFMKGRWKDKVEELVELGVEAAQRELEGALE